MGWFPAWSGESSPELSVFEVTRGEDGLAVNFAARFDLPPSVEGALLKGVPLHFVADAALFRERWYWRDQLVSRVSRTWRLAYQPLTRRWRLSYASGTAASAALQYGLHQNFDSLADALLSAGHVSNWKLIDAARWNGAGEQRVEFSFALDLTQLPRPFQLGLFNQSSWNITLQKTLDVPDQISNEAEPALPDSRSEDDA